MSTATTPPASSPPPLAVTTPGGSYHVHVGAGVLRQLPEALDQLELRGACWLVYDSGVAPHATRLADRLRAAGRRVEQHAVQSGEQSKDITVAMELYTWMIGGGVERRDVVLALGGGVVGDLAGFVAATVLRGIAVVQLPTTLLSMVDSAIGGKTGINHPLGKNLIGAFHQPRLVLSDTDLLESLPPRELRSGWAEVIKHGVIRDAGLFELLERQAAGAINPALIQRAVKVKIDVVNVDERETGERMLLNYGHTLGHAVEAAAGYGQLLHGEAIAIGMDLEARMAEQLGMVGAGFVTRQRALIHAYGLPTALPRGMDPEEIMERTLRDKKVSAGKIRWVLPTGVGGAVVRSDIPAAVVQNVLVTPSQNSA